MLETKQGQRSSKAAYFFFLSDSQYYLYVCMTGLVASAAHATNKCYHCGCIRYKCLTEMHVHVLLVLKYLTTELSDRFLCRKSKLTQQLTTEFQERVSGRDLPEMMNKPA